MVKYLKWVFTKKDGGKKLNSSALKNRLFEQIKNLPEKELKKVFMFISSLKSNQSKELEKAVFLNPDKDPILNFIGGVEHGSLARDIDKELYGE